MMHTNVAEPRLLTDGLDDALAGDLLAWTPAHTPLAVQRDPLDADPRPTTREVLADIIDQGGPQIVFQAVHHIESGHVIGAEALSRFPLGLTTGAWFEEAHRIGIGTELELSAVAATIERLDDATWRRVGWDFVGLNVSPALAFDDRFAAVVAGHPGERFVVELTEQAATVPDASLRGHLDDLRDLGVRIAVTSVMCEPTNLVRLLDVAPEIIKLDVSFTAALVREPARRGLASEILRDCVRAGVFVVAVGVEHDDELAILRKLGVDAVQGHLFGQPRPIDKMGPRPMFPAAPRW